MAANSLENDGEPEASTTDMHRRTLLRSSAAGAGALASGGAMYTLGTESAAAVSVDCEAVSTGVGAAIGAGISGGAGLAVGGALGYAVGQHACPSEFNRSKEEQEADWENWVEMYNRARKGQLYDENQLAATRRGVGGMRQQAIIDAMNAVANEAAAGSDMATGREQAKNAANEMLRRTYEGYWNHWTLRLGEFEDDAVFMAGENFTTARNTVVDAYDHETDGWVDPTFSAGDGSVTVFPGGDSYSTVDMDLPDGSTISVPHKVVENKTVSGSSPYNASVYVDPTIDAPSGGQAALTSSRIREPDPSEYDAINESEVDSSDFDGPKEYVQVEKFNDTLDELESVRQATIDQVDILIDQHWEALAAGEITPAEITGAAGVLDSMENADSFRQVVVGFKTQGYWVADSATVVEFDNPDGEGTIEVDGQFGFMRQTEPQPIPVGAAVDASNLAGDLYLAYNLTDDEGNVTGGTFTQVTNTFTVAASEDGSNSIEWTRNAISETDVTVDEIRTILEDIKDSRDDADEARQDINVEGDDIDLGFGGLFDSAGKLPSWLSWPLILIAVGVAAAYKAVKGN